MGDGLPLTLELSDEGLGLGKFVGEVGGLLDCPIFGGGDVLLQELGLGLQFGAFLQDAVEGV
ncbi:MAG: hypothetical protein GPJ00_16535 [Microcystis aeruginosa W13-18]|nr:hypothetical protein [Microcystis aeruginosa W13-18]